MQDPVLPTPRRLGVGPGTGAGPGCGSRARGCAQPTLPAATDSLHGVTEPSARTPRTW